MCWAIGERFVTLQDLLFQQRMREEVGDVDYPAVLSRWQEWVKEQLIKELISRKKAQVLKAQKAAQQKAAHQGGQV